MKRLLLAFALTLVASPALAQGVPNSATVVNSCGTPPTTYTAGQVKSNLQDTTGQQCVKATVSGTVVTSNASVGATGAAVPSSGTYVGINSGGNLLGASAGSGTAAGALRVELPTDGTGKVGLNAGTAIIGKVSIDQTTPGTTNGVQVNAALPAGTAIIGKVGIDQTTPGTTNAVSATNFPTTVSTGTGAQGASSPRVTVATDTATIAGSAPGTTASPSTNAISTVRLSSAASTAGVAPVASSALAANTVIKNGAGNLYSFQVAADSTLSGAAWWLMIYNATSAPADGAVTPAKCYALPSGSTGFTGAFNQPVYFSTGIVIGVSTTGCFTKTASTHAFISGDAR